MFILNTLYKNCDPPPKKKRKENPLWCFSKLRHFIRWNIGKYRKKRRYDPCQPFEGRTEKVSTCKTAKVDHVYQHVIKTEDVLLLSLLEHYIIECTRILRNNYCGCFCVCGFFLLQNKKQNKTKTPPPQPKKQSLPLNADLLQWTYSKC